MTECIAYKVISGDREFFAILLGERIVLWKGVNIEELVRRMKIDVLYGGRFIDESDSVRNCEGEIRQVVEGGEIRRVPLSSGNFRRVYNMFDALKPGTSVGFGFICNPTNRRAGYWAGEKVPSTDSYRISQGAEVAATS